ncbi:16057_t:CDS:2, partial [Racocetra persica]
TEDKENESPRASKQRTYSAEVLTKEITSLRRQISDLQESISKSVHDFEVIVSPKRNKPFRWTVNIESITIKKFRKHIFDIYKTSALENPTTTLNFINGADVYKPRDDDSFKEMLRILLAKNRPKFT